MTLDLNVKSGVPRLGRRLEGQRQVTDGIVLWFWPVTQAALGQIPDTQHKNNDSKSGGISHSNFPLFDSKE